MNEPIEFRSGHRFVDNGVGDYELICPKHGKAPYFIPYMLARTATADRTCPGCHEPLGGRVHDVTVSESANATEEVAAKRKVSMSINDSAGAKDPKL